MPIILDRFDGGENDFQSPRDLNDNQFQVFKNMLLSKITRAIKSFGFLARTAASPEIQLIPGQGFFAYRTEWDNSGTPINVSTLWRIIIGVAVVGDGPATSFVIANRNNTLKDNSGTWENVITGTSVWPLRSAGANLVFTASTKIISGDVDLEQFEPGDTLRIQKTDSFINDGYYTVVEKAPAASSVTVLEDITDQTSTLGIVAAVPILSMYAVGGNLRISNGIFQDANPSQWYGYIKRTFWGKTFNYGSNGGRYSQPPMVIQHGAWALKNQELVAPTIIRGTRVGAATSAANEIAIHPASEIPSTWPEKAPNTEWNRDDRLTCTYTYDFVQESELGRGTNGEIGIALRQGRLAISNIGRARAFMIEAYTGASNADWNQRITAINFYYKFHDDPDWYLVEVLDVEKGWKESTKVFDSENTGYWQPIIQSVAKTGTANASGGSGVTVTDTSHGVIAGEQIYLMGDLAGSTTTFEPTSLVSVPSDIPDVNTMTLPVAAVNSEGEIRATYNSVPWIAGTISTTAVATFFIPYNGERTASYFTRTGRSAALKVPATRWRASDTDGVRVLIGNIDTKDENEQTQRERSRVIESPSGMPDVLLLTNSKDVGIQEGDQVIAIKYFAGVWWVMLERNVTVLQPGTLIELQRFNKVGCQWENGFAATRHGLAVADKSKITLLPSGKELTLQRRDAYQALDFFHATMAYSINRDALHFIPRTGLLGQIMWVYSFQNDSWRTENIPTVTAATGLVYSNFASNLLHNEPEIVYQTPNTFTAIAYQLNSGTSSETGEIKTKEYHLGVPYIEKTIGKGYLSYKSTSQEVTVEAFRNGESTAYKTRKLDASTSITNAQIKFNTRARLFTFRFTSTATDFLIEEFVVPNDQIEFHDR